MRVSEGFSRRSWLFLATAATAFGQTDADPMRLLKTGHPRLILPDSDLERVRSAAKEHPIARRLFQDFEKECDGLLSVPPVEYKLSGNRLQIPARRAIDRVTTLSLMYRLTNKDAWLRRAVMELNAVANFRDWNPARFVDTAEMTHAVAIGYDWLYNALSAEERAWMREAIVSKGLGPALPIYQKQTWWTREKLNWNVICNSAMAMGALAVGEEVKEGSEVLRAALESIPRGLSSWNADGSWPEGPVYGAYAAHYATLFFASLDTALGRDFGLSGFAGVDHAARFRVYMTGPAGRLANFGDGGEDAGSASDLFWMARRLNVPAYSWAAQRLLDKGTRAEAYDLAWFDRDARAPQLLAFPLDGIFHGEEFASFRSAWDDPSASFLVVKAGDTKAPHTHLDLGSFVFDAGGTRWAADLPVDGSRNEWHNTLTIEGEMQDARAEARMIRQEITADLSWVQMDLTKTSTKLKQWIRKVGLAQRQALLIEDEVRADQPVDVVWGMTTSVDFSVNGSTALFRKNGWNLSAEIRAPRHAVFDSAPIKAAAGYRKLIVRLPDKVSEVDLSIALIPWREGQPKPRITAQFPA